MFFFFFFPHTAPKQILELFNERERLPVYHKKITSDNKVNTMENANTNPKLNILYQRKRKRKISILIMHDMQKKTEQSG